MEGEETSPKRKRAASEDIGEDGPPPQIHRRLRKAFADQPDQSSEDVPLMQCRERPPPKRYLF